MRSCNKPDFITDLLQLNEIDNLQHVYMALLVVAGSYLYVVAGMCGCLILSTITYLSLTLLRSMHEGTDLIKTRLLGQNCNEHSF